MLILLLFYVLFYSYFTLVNYCLFNYFCNNLGLKGPLGAPGIPGIPGSKGQRGLEGIPGEIAKPGRYLLIIISYVKNNSNLDIIIKN